jgi:uncharacterized membrane protein YkoI
MFNTARKTVVTVAALGALALGGSAIAGAAQSGSSATTGTAQSTQSAQQGRPAGPHSVNGKTEQPLTGDTAAKVKAAALKKVSGTVERVETNVDSSAPYEAHIRKSDGTEVEVQVSKSFEVTAVNDMQHP